jgi:hypothetical protein
MRWKIYFWILAIIAGWNVIMLIGQILAWQVSGVYKILVSVIYALATYSYAYKKHIFSQRHWKVWLVIVLSTLVLVLSPLFISGNTLDSLTIITLIIGIIVFQLPAWYCIYRLGFGNKERVNVAVVKTFKRKTAKKVGTK